MKKSLALIISIVMLLSLIGCGSDDESSNDGKKGSGQSASGAAIVLDEPVFLSNNADGKPVFSLNWSEYKGTSDYQIAIMVEGEDTYGRGPFAIRDTLNIYNASSRDIKLLDGIYTDTATYRIKVRPRLSSDMPNMLPKDFTWSNIWEIRFDGGKYSVAATDADFDLEDKDTGKGAASSGKTDDPSSGTSDKTSNDTGVDTSVQAKDPLKHSFPESLAEYLARERGSETPADLGQTAKLTVGVNYCEYGQVPQEITDKNIIRAFTDAVSGMKVTGLKDNVLSTGTYMYYVAQDSSGQTILSFSIQDGLLMRDDGRYSIEGLQTLGRIEGILDPDGWDDYYSELDALRSKYQSGFDPKGKDVFDAAGYDSHVLKENGAQSISFITIQLDKNKDVEKLNSKDPDVIGKIVSSLSTVKVTGNKSKEGNGEKWRIAFDYYDEKYFFINTVQIEFEGDRLKIGNDYYPVDGLDGFCGCVDADVLSYIKNYVTAPTLAPKY